MHRIDSTGAVNGMWQNGNPTAGLMSTRGDANYWNALQEEVCNCVESAGMTLIKGDYTQLRTAIRLHQVGPVVLGPYGWSALGGYAANVDLGTLTGKRFVTATTDTTTVVQRELELPPNSTVTDITIRYGRSGTNPSEFLMYLRKHAADGTETTLAQWDLNNPSLGVAGSSGLALVIDRANYGYSLVLSMTNADARSFKLYGVSLSYMLK